MFARARPTCTTLAHPGLAHLYRCYLETIHVDHAPRNKPKMKTPEPLPKPRERVLSLPHPIQRSTGIPLYGPRLLATRKAGHGRAVAPHQEDRAGVTMGSSDQHASNARVPPTLNWHLTPSCNYSCRFCFATFEDIPKNEALGQLQSMLQVLSEVKALGFTRITFVGGEPLLHPCIDQLIVAAKRLGLNTCLVTNGSLLTPQRLRNLAGSLDILAFSVDASTDHLHTTMGRGLRHEVTQVTQVTQPTSHLLASPTTPPVRNAHIARVLALCPLAHDLGITLKINTVVTRANLHDDMTQLIRAMAPARWKIFQVLPVEGQNTGGSVEPLLITREEFEGYMTRAVSGMSGSSTVSGSGG